MRSALIIGGDSTIGAALALRLRADGVQVETTSRRRGPLLLDLAAPPETWPELPGAEVAYLCAAVASLDACESDPPAARRVNVTHAQALAERLFKSGAHVVFLSTNQVFDGSRPCRKATDATCPVTEYGRQKAAMEQWLLSRDASVGVLRLTKVIAATLPILAKWTAALERGESIEAFADLVFAPLRLDGVIEALAHIGHGRSRGLFQLSGARDVSYCEIALALAAKLGFPPNKIIAASANAAGIRPQFLPLHATLETSAPLARLAQEDPMRVIFNTTFI